MKKLIFIILFIPSFLFSVSSGTFTVKEDGTGNFTTLASALAGLQGTLISPCTIQVEGSWTNADTTQLQPTGWTTYTTAYLLITAAGQSRHNGIWNETNKHRLSGNGYNIGMIYLGYGEAQHFKVDGLQISASNASNPIGMRLHSGTSAGWFREISNCLVVNKSSASPNRPYDSKGIVCYVNNSTGGTYKVWNSIFSGWGLGYDDSQNGQDNTTDILYNNTFYETGKSSDPVYYGSIALWDYATDKSIYLKNNLIYSTTVCFHSISAFTTKITSNNVTNDQTSPDSDFRGLQAIFLNVSATNYQPVYYDTSTQVGVSLNPDIDGQLNVLTDITGKARLTNPTIGAWERQPFPVVNRKTITWQGE